MDKKERHRQVDRKRVLDKLLIFTSVTFQDHPQIKFKINLSKARGQLQYFALDQKQ